MSKLQLFALMIYPGTPVVTIDGVTGIFQGLERESGNGNTFNVTLLVTEDNGDYAGQRLETVKRTFFVRTTD